MEECASNDWILCKTQGQDLEIIDIVESQIQELGNIDKNGDIFRYPTSYSLEYRFDNINIDLNNTYEFMQGIFNFVMDAMANLMLLQIGNLIWEVKWHNMQIGIKGVSRYGRKNKKAK